MYRLRGRLRMTAAVAVAALGATAGAATFGGTASARSVGSNPLPQVKVTMDPHHVTVSGNLVSGAVTVTPVISGEQEGDFAFIRLNPGVTYAQFYKFVSTHPFDDPNIVSNVGSLVVDYAAPKGTSHFQTRLLAGNYVALDTGGQNGPHTQFQIKHSQHPEALPAADATVKAIEFGFRGNDTLKQGSVVRFENTGYLVHMIAAIHTRNDQDAQKIVAALRRGDDDTAQKLATGFASFLDPASHGAVQQETLQVAKGTWVLSCFLDTQDGREHTQIGMEKIIHVQ